MFENLVQGYVAVGQVYHRDGRVGTELVVDRQPPEVFHPCESALHDPPPPGRHEVPARQPGLPGDLEPRAEPLHHPVGQTSPVPAVGNDPHEAAGRAAQPVEDEHGALAVVDVGGVHRRAYDKSKTVSDNVLLAPLHLLVPVYAAVRVRMVRRPRAARVDDSEARLPPSAEPLRPEARTAARTPPRPSTCGNSSRRSARGRSRRGATYIAHPCAVRGRGPRASP